MKRIIAAVGIILVIICSRVPTKSIPFLNALGEASDALLGGNNRSDVATDF